ncbi:MAG: hypothetical protein ACK4N5_06575, partial [Myxococcales bacterium]
MNAAASLLHLRSHLRLSPLVAALLLVACGGEPEPTSVDAGATMDAGSQPATDAGAGTDDAGSAADAGEADAGSEADAGHGVHVGQTVDAGSSYACVTSDAGPQPAGVFYGYITPSALSVVAGGTVSFSGTGVGGSGSYEFAWTFNGTPNTATGPGPHTVTFTGSGARELTMLLTDTVTKEQWSQRIAISVSTGAVNGLAVTMNKPSGGTAEVGQGGALEISGSGAATWTVAPGNTGVNGVVAGNLVGAYLPFPFIGSFSPGVVGSANPPTNTGAATASITVVPEPTGTLDTGKRIGPLQGTNGCFACDGYSDNRIALQLASDGAGRYLAVFDQKAKAVDADDSVIGAFYDGGAWLPWIDLDASSGKGVSDVGLGEGNPERQHQFDAHLSPSGDAAVAFIQAVRTVSPLVKGVSPHVLANIYVAGTGWTGALRVDSEPDNSSNMTRDPRIVVWREGSVTRALAVWRRRANGALDRIDYATWSSATGTWSAAANLVPNSTSTGGYANLRLVRSGNRALLVWQQAYSPREVRAAIYENGAWTFAPAPLFTAQVSGLRLRLAAGPNGTAALAAAYSNGDVSRPVYLVRYDGAAWQAPVHVGATPTVDDLMPTALGTGWDFKRVSDLQLALDADGNALLAWVPEVSNGGSWMYLGAAAYCPTGASCAPWSFFTALASLSDVEMVRDQPSAIAPAELGLALSTGRGIVTYPVSSRSMPQGAYHDQLHYRRFTPAQGWSARALVDTHP